MVNGAIFSFENRPVGQNDPLASGPPLCIQKEQPPGGPLRAVASPLEPTRPQADHHAAGAFRQKEQPPARPDARPRFTGPPPMDKVRPESQSEHTPVPPVRAVASPLEPTRPHS